VMGHARHQGTRTIPVFCTEVGVGGWMIGGTMNLSPSTDRQYKNFNMVFLYKASVYATGTKLGTEGAGAMYRVPGGKLSGTGT
jgi:hypothetical protein